jgi:hypothetical protein
MPQIWRDKKVKSENPKTCIHCKMELSFGYTTICYYCHQKRSLKKEYFSDGRLKEPGRCHCGKDIYGKGQTRCQQCYLNNYYGND